MDVPGAVPVAGRRLQPGRQPGPSGIAGGHVADASAIRGAPEIGAHPGSGQLHRPGHGCPVPAARPRVPDNGRHRGRRRVRAPRVNAAGVTISDVVRVTPATGDVTRVGALAEPTHGAAAVTHGGRILVFGGAATTVHTAVQSFDPSTGITRVIGSLPGPRADLAATTAGGRPVLLGGFDGSGPLDSVLVTSGTTGFRTLTRLPQAVRYPAVAVSGGDIYLFGGLLSGGEYTGTFTPLIQQIDPATETARIAGRLPYPVAHAKAVVLDGQILILGGSTPQGPTSDILRFDPARQAITHVGRLPAPSTDGAVAAVGDTGYLAGGLSANGPLDQIVIIKLHLSSPARSAG